MFKKLHRQMTFFCTLITSLILISMTCLCLLIAERNTKERSYISFSDNLTSIFSYFEEQNVISHQWLLQMESTYHLKMHILDNGNPLFSQRLGSSDEYPPELFEQARDIAYRKYGIDSSDLSYRELSYNHAEFKMHGEDSGEYYASVALIPKKNGVLNVTALYSLDAQEKELRHQRLLFASIDVLAVLLLFLFSWHFTKRMIKPIRESRERQAQFIAAASHELRSPLTVILSSLSAMKMADKEQAEAFSDTIQAEGQRMSRLIGDMLSLANADNRSWSIHASNVEPDTLLLQTYEKFESLASQKGLRLSVNIPDEDCPACSMDGERIAQVLSILIDNAMSYTPKGGQISLSLARSCSKLSYTVADNGPGIPDDQKEAVFERFYRTDKSHKSKSHFGLGLCIAQEIVKLHKGRIQVKDTPGGGATFTVVLPVQNTFTNCSST
ncbi:sensor histidine kinase [Murimonas intestini]|uniref:sensor histidine kinase n=1 Tax=Murimonas intestini TaxID=1337051 RepID=UPI0011DCA6FB|nr:HAMP domain-containing sensor histidine kinase [Murimonas intestini]